MQVLTGARIVSAQRDRAEIGLERGYRLLLFFLDTHLARLLVAPAGGLRTPRTWSLSPELLGKDPIDGRDRLDLTGFPGSEILEVRETEAAIAIETALLKVEVCRSPLALSWFFRPSIEAAFEPVLQDRQTGAYFFSHTGAGFAHYLARDPAENYYGFGEKSGDANKAGRRLHMAAADALGYDAETSDPLYKHVPFYVSARPDLGGRAVGLFYDNLAPAAFDLGQEISAYHGPFRSFEADGGDLDLYSIFGPCVREVVGRFTALTGRTAFPPRWSLSYSGSAMRYTDAPDAESQLSRFLAQLSEHQIPCGSFHLSSGYTLRDGKRYVFNWDKSRFPDPRRLAARFAHAGLRLIANVKPALLTDHPRFAEVEAFRGFIRNGEDETRPHIAQFWGGKAAFLDFTNAETSAWWQREVKAKLLDYGVAATWNDNNEFDIADDCARADVKGRGLTMECLRPVQTGLMLRASQAARRKHAPSKRPFLVSRSGGPGMQRYAQTWTGDNFTSWKTLRYNLRMGHGLSLSGIFNFGHDVGGFAGPRPEPELFMRWIEQGIYWPRFSIHSWKEDGSANEPWMYPELVPLIRQALNWRERLVPLLYTHLWRAHVHHEPLLLPLFYNFPEQPRSYAENDEFMLGSDLLIAPIVERGAKARRVWLPHAAGGWFSIASGELLPCGEVEVPAPLGAAPAFMRAGSILPLGQSPSWADGALTLRLYPLAGARAELELFDDDGESHADPASPPCLLTIAVEWGPENAPSVAILRSGPRPPRWPEIRFEDERGRPVSVTLKSSGGLRVID